MKPLSATALVISLAAFGTIPAHAQTYLPQATLTLPTNGSTFQITEQMPSGLWLAFVPIEVDSQFIQVTGTPGSKPLISWNMSLTYNEGGASSTIAQDEQLIPTPETIPPNGVYIHYPSYSGQSVPPNGKYTGNVVTPKPCTYAITAFSSITPNGQDPIPQSATSNVTCVFGPGFP